MGNKQAKPTLMDTVIDVKMAVKELERASKQAEKQEKIEKGKIKKAIEKGNKEGAQIYAQNAIRKKHEALNFLRLASKMDAVATKLETAEKSQQISQTISNTVPMLGRALAGMTPEKMAMDMNNFEKIFEDLDVRTEYMTNAIDATTAQTTPPDQVDALISQVGDEHTLDVSNMMQTAPVGQIQAGAQPAKAEAAAEGDLESRLAQLRGGV